MLGMFSFLFRVVEEDRARREAGGADADGEESAELRDARAALETVRAQERENKAGFL